MLLVYRYLVSRQSSGQSGQVANKAEEKAPKQWKLPRPNHATLKQLSKEEVTEEFRGLDLAGDGKLKFLQLRSALEIQDISVSDEDLRRWLRETDRQGKGYVGLEDYLSIYGYRGERAFAARKPDISPLFDETAVSVSRSSVSAAERKALLKQAFGKFDVDRDGFISVEDLRVAFDRKGRAYADADLIDWVRKRDTMDIGAVSFEDFAKYF